MFPESRGGPVTKLKKLFSQITTKRYLIIFLLPFNGVDLSKANNGLVVFADLLQVANTGEGPVDQMPRIGYPIKRRLD